MTEPVGAVVFNPGPPASMEIRSDGTALPEPGDTMTVQGAYTTATYRVGEVADAGGGRWVVRLLDMTGEG